MIKHERLSIQDLEYAINFWRQAKPSEPSSMTLCHEASVLANLYGQWIITGKESIPIEDLSQTEVLCLEEPFKATKQRAA